MATAAQWVDGARPRTLLLAVAPVITGTGVAAYDAEVRWGRAALALVVALALQVGVNYANDHSDGVRGTDTDRVGPLRLVGSGAASARAVLTAAVVSFAVAALAGLGLAALSTWWLIAVGAAAIAAAWLYTGGPVPYGYHALGEVFVLVFFGFVATVGTAYVQTGAVSGTALLAACCPGFLACAVLVANNLRDIPGDTVAGKRTLAVVLGDGRTRALYGGCLVLAFVPLVPLAITRPWVALVALALPLAWWSARPVVRAGAIGRGLVPTLKWTGLLADLAAVLLAAGLALSA